MVALNDVGSICTSYNGSWCQHVLLLRWCAIDAVVTWRPVWHDRLLFTLPAFVVACCTTGMNRVDQSQPSVVLS